MKLVRYDIFGGYNINIKECEKDNEIFISSDGKYQQTNFVACDGSLKNSKGTWDVVYQTEPEFQGEGIFLMMNDSIDGKARHFVATFSEHSIHLISDIRINNDQVVRELIFEF
jgi:hypothetical protein